MGIKSLSPNLGFRRKSISLKIRRLERKMEQEKTESKRKKQDRIILKLITFWQQLNNIESPFLPDP